MLMGFPYVMENGVPCFVRHMTEEIFFLYLCGLVLVTIMIALFDRVRDEESSFH